MKTQKIWALAVVCLLTSGSPISARQAKVGFSITPQRPRPGVNRQELAVGAAAPEWRLKTVEGETVALSGLRGKVVVLDFWANWCGPCRKLEPLFDQLAQEFQSMPVKFFTLSVWPDRDFNPQDYQKERRKASTFLIGDDAVANNYGIWGVPTYCVIDPEGKVAFFHTLLVVDPDALGNRLREAVEQALPKKRDAQSSFHQSFFN